ncbi:hypothetical protein VA249_45600 (plasmid) [Vibrio alfacsensis]|uniref:hypothetical protein n=1 Tax=Vibrio alfacsensis TaxID=1074311 RepID=UPI001BEF1B2B|nr:hypothetical protein [Vibrio alfacsensis]BBM67914.1 hypothetical protein VA249_45600 [Vibrio alfacsensis]
MKKASWVVVILQLIVTVGCASNIECGKPYTIIDGIKQQQEIKNISHSTEKRYGY